MMRFRSFAALLPVGLLAAAAANAQGTGRLSGMVLDPNGGVVPQAAVNLYLAGGERPILSAETTRRGLFRLIGVRAGLYDLSVDAPGFQRELLREVKIDPRRETALPAIELSLGEFTFTVEVSAGIESLQTNDAEVSVTVSSEQVRRLPLLDRNPLRLIATQAGVSANRIGATVINGQRTSFSNVTFDGINIQDNLSRSNGLDFTPNFLVLDQVAEFTLTTSNANATVGGGASQIAYVSPSGTNQFHGSAYWSHRNSALAANEWFLNADGLERPARQQHQVGGTFAGPIVREKLLFSQTVEYFNLPGERQQFRTILTEDARNGVFSYVDPQGAIRKLDPRDFGVPIDAFFDPLIGGLLARTPAPGEINNFRFGDSSEGRLLNTAGYSFLAQHDLKRWNTTSRVDYLHSTDHVFAASFHWNRVSQQRSDLTRNTLSQLQGLGIVPGNGFEPAAKVVVKRNPKLFSGSWRWNPTPRFTNEVRGGFNLAPIDFAVSEDLGEFFLSETTLVFSNPRNLFQPEGRNTNTYQFQDNAGYVRGAHNLQFGFQSQSIVAETFGNVGVVPSVSLAGEALASALVPDLDPNQSLSAAFLYGNLFGSVGRINQTFNVRDRDSGFAPGIGKRRNFRHDSRSFYIHDNWKAARKLTVTLGLRYELFLPPTESDGLALLPVVEGGDAIRTLLSNHTVDFAGSGTGRRFHRIDKNNFAPNVGLAWDLAGTGETVVRASYSIHYVNDETLRTANFVTESIEGLFIDAATPIPLDELVLVSSLSGTLVETPEFKVPRTLFDNFLVNRLTSTGLIDERLRTPFVQEWSLGVQRRIGGMILDARYVGNRGVRLARTLEINNPVLEENGFLGDFLRARTNGELALARVGEFDPAFNPALEGSAPLPVFDRLGARGLLRNPTVRALIRTNQTADLAGFYQAVGLAGDVVLFPNPITLGASFLTNASASTYHALQIDLRRRIRAGLQFQGNYTFSKVLTDAVSTDPTRFDPYLDPKNGRLERARASFDLTHAIKGNFIWELPMGGGRRIGSGKWAPLAGGWTVSGILTWQSGNPFSIFSGRGTINLSAFSSLNTADTALTKPDIDELLKVRTSGSGPFFLNERAIAADGRADPSVFRNPEAGKAGALQRRQFSGPWTFNFDLAVLKNFALREGMNAEFRMEAVNLFNNASWVVFDQAINDPQFGRITQTAYPSRKIQLGLSFRF